MGKTVSFMAVLRERYIVHSVSTQRRMVFHGTRGHTTIAAGGLVDYLSYGMSMYPGSRNKKGPRCGHRKTYFGATQPSKRSVATFRKNPPETEGKAIGEKKDGDAGN